MSDTMRVQYTTASFVEVELYILTKKSLGKYCCYVDCLEIIFLYYSKNLNNDSTSEASDFSMKNNENWVLRVYRDFWKLKKFNTYNINIVPIIYGSSE